MPSPGAVQVVVLAFQVALVRLVSTQSTTMTTTTTVSTSSTGPTLTVPCCFASAQNASSLGPVVVLRRDDEQPPVPGMVPGMAPGSAYPGLSGAPPGAGNDPTWEATLRRAATRALTWEGLGEAPFVASYHSAETLAALDEPGDIRVLARGLLVSDRDARPVFREVDLPGEHCVHCPTDKPGPNGESIKAMWSVRRIRHSGPNADHRPCYELQFSVTPIAGSLPALSRWEPGAAGAVGASRGLRAELRAESRVSRQRELRPKGLILRVNPPLELPDVATASVGDTLPLQQLAADALPSTPRRPSAIQRTDAVARLASTLATAAATPSVTTTSARVHEHLHHHFYMRGGVPVYAGSTTETEFPPASPTRPAGQTSSPPFKPSPQYHEYSQPDPLFHPPPGFARPTTTATKAVHSTITTGHALHFNGQGAKTTTPTVTTSHAHFPNSINEQLPPAGADADTRVPYVSASKQTVVTPAGTSLGATLGTPASTMRPSATTLRFPPETDAGPSVTILPATQMYRITGAYTLTTPNSLETVRPTKPTPRTKMAAQNYYEVGRPTKVYPDFETTDPTEPSPPGRTSTRASSPRTAKPTSEYLSEYPAATVRGTTMRPTPTNRVPLFTPHYGKDFEMSILKVMTSKVPTYIDIFTENGIHATTVQPATEADDMLGLSQSPIKYSTKHTKNKPRHFKGRPSHSAEGDEREAEITTQKLSTTLKTGRNPLAEPTTSASPLQITFFVATEDETKHPSASTLVGDPYKQDDTTTYQYTILRSVEKSIKVMKGENDTNLDEIEDQEEPLSSTRRIYTFNDEPVTGVLHKVPTTRLPSTIDPQSIVNGHTNHINSRAKQITESSSQIIKNISLITDPPTTRKPWRPSTRSRRPWRQRSNYKDYYQQRRGLNHTSDASSVDPTSIVESRKTYSVSASTKRKPFNGPERKSYLKQRKSDKRREHVDHQSKAESLHERANSNIRAPHRVSTAARFLRSNVEHSTVT